ncbi:hypothetical protein GA0116948_1188 [Chitinophaga costaii]|uniref:DUF2071 domain-containing protein n=1 Tax=Chitinophaga costaii TaxID=1335309 RepID=A0A1C4FXE1_9BACT|nr:DUF2071 domain-containing protein [Chitinophaga costaii]PUZ20887.1 DUF2071 domain-containing protein [Chitinophaga costaii]SCC60542.1 hypothetical protein GA0116948_1188 [Chitinophaga costaii]
MSNSIFLTAEWRKLAMANYAVDPGLLQRYVPRGTELDTWNATCYVSLVAFMFERTCVMGCRIPFHQDFEEVNLRFYVRYKDGGNWKRGVVFIREFVPLRMVTFVANTFYDECYQTFPMRHTITIAPETLEVEYKWKKGDWNRFGVTAANKPFTLIAGSQEEFITEHFWGYGARGPQLSEYQVAHDPWQLYPVNSYMMDVNFEACYGTDFRFLQGNEPTSVFLAEGSEIQVYKDRKISI